MNNQFLNNQNSHSSDDKMIIHFFRDRNIKEIDYVELIDGYFDNLDNSTIKSNDDEVNITMDIKEFDFQYHFAITKRSRVSSLYRLNINYKNTNLLCEIPCIIPQYISRLIFKQISEICDKFKLAIYYEKFDNIREFDMFELISCLGKKRTEYLESNPDFKTYQMPMNVLNEMCIYQSNRAYLQQITKEEVIPEKYNIMVEKHVNDTYDVVTSIDWLEGTPTIIPPHLNYICIKENESIVTCVPIEVFMKYAEKLSYEIKDDSIDFKVLYVNKRGALKLKKLVKKMQKAQISLTNFINVKFTDLIEN